MKGIRLVGAVVAAVLALPAGAQAATLTNAGGTLTYTAAPGTVSQIGFDQPSPGAKTVEVHRFIVLGDDDPIAPTGCTVEETTAEFVRYSCPGVTEGVIADTGDGADAVDGGGALVDMGAPAATILVNISIEADLGAGDDLGVGGRAGDVLDGGDGNDQLALDPVGGGPGGDDVASGGNGNDGVLSGRGDDIVDLGEGNDNAGGGPGDDTLTGGAGDDNLAAGPGDDTLSGQDGNDTLVGECGQPCPPGEPAGGDDVNGGDGFDLFQYDSFEPGALTITLDDVANDGIAGENDNVSSNVEDVKVTGPADATVTGTTGMNILTTGDGADTINSRDGHTDRVACGAGADTANADTVDIVGLDCETVNRVDSGNVFEDKAPTVAFTAPASDSVLSTGRPNSLSANASDDRGIARVQFLDDERTVCSDTTVPYSCDYTPQGDDVGRNTLVVIAVDTAGQTASAVRAVRVPRFVAVLSARTRPRRDTSAPYRFTTTGRLTLPSGVTPAQACSGTVTVQIKAARKTVSTRRVKLRSNCTYRSRVTFRSKQRLRPRTLRRSVRFGGNAVLGAKSAKRQTLRVRS